RFRSAMTQMHPKSYGRAADSVRTVLHGDYVISFLEDIYTPMERTLLDSGRVEAVTQARLAFQQAMKEDFVRIVEEATGRKVRAFLSQVHFDPDLAAEVFVLEPDGRGAAEDGAALG